MDQQAKLTFFKQLTWPALQEWAGGAVAERGRSYQRAGRVQQVARAPDGGIVAWVVGTQRYATLVDVGPTGLWSDCTCPYGGTCKHAVALALAYLADLQRQAVTPTAAATDPRLVLLEAGDEADDEEWEEDEEDEGDEGDEAVPAGPPAAGGAPRPGKNSLRGFLEDQTQGELIALLEELAGRFPEVNDALEARRTLATGTLARLVHETRKLIIEASARPGWRGHWGSDDSYSPDYTEVRDRLELLRTRGHADAVLELGELLLEEGKRQVEESDDEGETGAEIAGCLGIVFRALPESSLTPSEQILWAIDRHLADEYDLTSDTGDFWERPWAPADWSLVADEMAARLAGQPGSANRQTFTVAYQRERLAHWLVRALHGAGRESEVIPLWEREADLNGSYDHLVKALLDAGRTAEAERWLLKGISVLDSTQAGTASGLRSTLRGLHEQAGDWPWVAALRAEEFFDHPTTQSFINLRAAAEQAGVWPAVRAAALHFLASGAPPRPEPRVVDGQAIPAWPLPATGLPSRSRPGWQPRFPQVGLLIEIAVDEQRPDEVLRWYDQARGQVVNSVLVADAVAESHPERAIAIWKHLADHEIAQTQPRAYEVAVGYLRKMGRVLKQLNRADEWRQYLATLRQTHARKRRLMEMLVVLDR